MFKGTFARSLVDFLAETLQARREWQNIFKVIKGKTPKNKNTLPI